ncbi:MULTISPECIES: c-type cytochrome [unclassified Thioalkalivibrio]|uniref:c-type cytochrome n=1 Tax=unclassified Thioalkalivibrio TaxID=2621013 RepID=UPI000363DE34|nr:MULTISPECIES: c-type cytochrome [unclassified Thioalkalivibrio]
MKTRTYIAGFFSALVLTSAAPAVSADTSDEITRGQLMAASCKACHNAAGANDGVTNLSTLSENLIASQMRAFRDDQRDGTIMNRHAKGYTDEEIDAMAAHFGHQ